MRDEMQDRPQILPRAALAPRQVHDQCRPARRRLRARQRRHGRLRSDRRTPQRMQTRTVASGSHRAARSRPPVVTTSRRRRRGASIASAMPRRRPPRSRRRRTAPPESREPRPDWSSRSPRDAASEQVMTRRDHGAILRDARSDLRHSIVPSRVNFVDDDATPLQRSNDVSRRDRFVAARDVSRSSSCRSATRANDIVDGFGSDGRSRWLHRSAMKTRFE